MMMAYLDNYLGFVDLLILWTYAFLKSWWCKNGEKKCVFWMCVSPWLLMVILDMFNISTLDKVWPYEFNNWWKCIFGLFWFFLCINVLFPFDYVKSGREIYVFWYINAFEIILVEFKCHVNLCWGYLSWFLKYDYGLRLKLLFNDDVQRGR